MPRATLPALLLAAPWAQPGAARARRRRNDRLGKPFWQSVDAVLAGFALSTAAGCFLHRHGTPLILSVPPPGFAIGFKKAFP
jgi:hypothetical protein